MGWLNPRLCGWGGVPFNTDMSPKPNTDYNLFILSEPKYISKQPNRANANNGSNCSSVALSIPPAAPNTTNSPTMNLII